jgi:hypothetical protein
MPIADITEDNAYRQLAERVLRTACATAQIEVGDIAFGQQDATARHSSLCCTVDPDVDDHETSSSDRTAAEHLRQIDPNGILREAEQRMTSRSRRWSCATRLRSASTRRA